MAFEQTIYSLFFQSKTPFTEWVFLFLNEVWHNQSSNFHQKFPKNSKYLYYTSFKLFTTVSFEHLLILQWKKNYVNAIWQILSDSHRFELETRLRVILGDV